MIGDPTVITNENLSVDDIYLQAVYVDEQNERLVIWLDPYHIFETIDVEDLKDDLFIDVPVEIKYGFFMPETHTTLAPTMPSSSPLHCPVSNNTKCYIWDRYVQNCTSGNTASYCSPYESLLRQWGLTPPTSTTSPPTTTPTPTPSLPDGVVFQDSFSNGLGQWTESGQREWQTGTLDENVVISGYTTSNIVAEADDCDDQACILTMSNAVDLSSYSSATLEFDRFVDIGLDTREYLKVQVGNNGVYTDIFYWTQRNGDDHRWHHETFDLSSYLSSGFKVRFLTEQSSSSEDVGIDNVIINVESVSACIITVNSQLQSSGAIRTSWNDCGDDYDRYNVYVSKNGGSDRLFRVTSDNSYTLSNTNEGSSYVMKVKARVASDRSSYTELFSGPTVSIPVVDRTAPVIMTSAGYTIAATSAQGVTMTFPATAHDAVDGIISVTCTPPSGSMFPVGHTTVRCTATDAAGNTATKNILIHVEPYVEPDADGDGFADNVDQCPNQASDTNNGCPVVPPVVPPTNGTSTIPTNGTSTIPVNGTKLVIYGGEVMRLDQFAYTSPKPQVDNGTISIGAITRDGQIGFVTAGHNVEIEPTTTFGGIFVGPTFIETNSTNPTIVIGGSVDAAFVPILEEDPYSVPMNQLKKRDGTIIDVFTNTTTNLISLDRQIELIGIHHNSEGRIQYANATVSLDTDYAIKNIVISNYQSIGGDSGGSIITTYDGTNNLIGIHKGAFCNFKSTLENNTMNFFDNRNSTSCPVERAIYKGFSTWENIRASLNLR